MQICILRWGVVLGALMLLGPAWAEDRPVVRLIDTSVDVLVAAGSSTEEDESIETLQGGGHDPKRRGFTLQQAELSLSGAVDPYLVGETHIVFGEEEVELEEAFGTTTSLPGGVELRAGQYLTEFGRVNPTHPHSWAWVDQPVIATRLLGPDGTRAPGARVAWLVPLPWYSELTVGAQNADHETMASFLGESTHSHGEEASADAASATEEGEHTHEGEFEETIGGLPRADSGSDALTYSVRWEHGGDVTKRLGMLVGVSGMHGPNAAGVSTRSTLYGADVLFKWRPVQNQRGYPFVSWQTELMQRDYEADPTEITLEDGDGLVFPGEDLEDVGAYSQVLCGLRPGWEVGLRGEYATGSGEGIEPRGEDPQRDNRVRLSPLVQYRPSEFSRVRLQLNYDDADHLTDGDAVTVWVGGEILFGTHPAHAY